MLNGSNVNITGYSVYSDKLEDISLKGKTVINTINQYSYCIAEEDENFKKALLGSDILLPDGEGIVWAARFLKGKKIKKIAGADLHEYLLKLLNDNQGSCFYIGSSQPTLDKIKNRVNKEYPNVKVDNYSPPYKLVFSSEDSDKMIDAINAFAPIVVFVGMTAPKQEKWVNEVHQKVKANIICSIGAVFDFYAGTVNRPAKFWIDLKLEWFIRLIKEPRRLWRRYLYYGPMFVFYILKTKVEFFIK